LALQMGPGPHQAAALIGQMCQLDLKPAFTGARPLPKDFQNERVAVEDLGLPFALQVALLDRRELRIDDNDLGLEGARFGSDLLDLAAAHQGGRDGAAKRNDVLGHDVEADGGGQPYGFGQTRLRITVERVRRFARLRFDMDDERRARSGNVIVRRGWAYALSPTISCSWSWIGPIGITVEIACL